MDLIQEMDFLNYKESYNKKEEVETINSLLKNEHLYNLISLMLTILNWARYKMD